MTESTSGAYELRETLLDVQGVHLTLGEKLILRDLSFSIRNIYRPNLHQGQVVGLLGPSGMGKTQLFRIMAGLNQPDSGKVLIGEHGDAVMPGRVGVVAQNYPLLSHRSVQGNMVVAGRNSGMSPEEATTKTKELLEKFKLDEHADKYPVQLSGGQRQRIAIAQQFMCSNDLLLMDEPFSGLDPLALGRMCEFVSEIAQTDELRTFVIVTHDISAAIEVCDTLLLLGRDKGPNGEFLQGARIQHTISLIERGLAWKEGIDRTPQFHATVDEVKDLFAHL